MINRATLLQTAVSCALLQGALTAEMMGQELDPKYILTCKGCQPTFRDHVLVVWPHVVRLLSPVPDNVVRLRR